MDGSIRRIGLGVALVLLLGADMSMIYKAVVLIAVGDKADALGLPNIGVGFAALLIPVVGSLLWLTYRVWQTLRYA